MEYKITYDNANDIKKFIVVSLFLLTSSFLYNDVIKYPSKLKIGYLANKKSHGSYWPLVRKILYNCFRKMNFHTSVVLSFVWHQHFLYGKYKNWHHMPQNDVIMSDFLEKIQKCFTYQYYASIQVWNHLHHLNRKYALKRILNFNVRKYWKILPILDKSSIYFDLDPQTPPNLHETCKTKLH